MRALVVFVVVVAAAAACTPTPSKSDVKGPEPVPGIAVQKAGVTIDTPTGPARFSVELAIKDAERQRGLMYREHLDDDAGMLFIFEKQRELSFWMKNTHIPLDMLYIDEAGTIAGIVEDAEPMTLVSRKIDKPSRYVLELNAGTSRKLGLAAGERVHFEQVPAALVDPRTLQ